MTLMTSSPTMRAVKIDKLYGYTVIDNLSQLIHIQVSVLTVPEEMFLPAYLANP